MFHEYNGVVPECFEDLQKKTRTLGLPHRGFRASFGETRRGKDSFLHKRNYDPPTTGVQRIGMLWSCSTLLC